MRKSVWMKISGWVVFTAGGIIFLVTGAELMNKENLTPWIGAFTMMAGMGLTMGSNLMAHLEHMKRLRDRQQGPDAPAE